MKNISKLIEKLQKSLAKADNVYNLFDRPKAKQTNTTAPKPAIDTRTRNDKIKDALASQGKTDDHILNTRSGESVGGYSDGTEDTEPTQTPQEIFNERVEDAKKKMADDDERNIVHKRQLRVLSEVHGKAGEYAAPFYEKMIENEAGNRVPDPNSLEGHEEPVPGMTRRVLYLGKSPKGHMFVVSGSARGEHPHLFEVSGEGKKPEFTRYPALPHRWDVSSDTSIPESHNNALRAEADSAKYAHLALKAIKYSKSFKSLFPAAGRYTEHGEFHPKDFKAEVKLYGYISGNKRLTDTLGYSTNSILVRGRNRSSRSFEVISPKSFEAGQTHNLGAPMEHPAYVVLPQYSGDGKEESKKIFETIMKDPKIAKRFPHGYKIVDDAKEAKDEIRKLAFRVVKSTKFIDILRKSAMKYNEIPGGDAAGMTPKDFTPAEQKAIKVGTKVENEEHGEHGTEIAMDHVSENGPTYYNKLKHMERSIKKTLGKGLEKAAKPATHNELANEPVPPSYGTIPNLAHHEAIDLASKHSKVAQKYASEHNKEAAAFHHAESIKYWNHGQKAKKAERSSYVKAPLKKDDTNPAPMATPPINPAAAAAVSNNVNNANTTGIDRVKTAATGAANAVSNFAGKIWNGNLGKSTGVSPVSPTIPKLPSVSKVPMTHNIGVGTHIRQGQVVTTDGFAQHGLQKADGDMFDKALQAHQAKGGSTFCFQKGDLAGHPLFAVGVHPDRTHVLDHPISKQDLVNFHSKNKDLFSQPGHVLGTWHDPESKQDMMDVVKVTPHEKEARELGQQHKQRAIFNLGQMKTVHLEKSVPIPPMTKKEEGEGEPIQGKKETVSSNIVKNPGAKAAADFHTVDGHQSSTGTSKEMIAKQTDMAVPPVALVEKKVLDPMKKAEEVKKVDPIPAEKPASTKEQIAAQEIKDRIKAIRDTKKMYAQKPKPPQWKLNAEAEKEARRAKVPGAFKTSKGEWMVKTELGEGEPIEGKAVKISSKIMKNLKAKATQNWHTEDGGQSSSESSKEMIDGVPKTAMPPVELVPEHKMVPMKIEPEKKSDSLG